MIASGFVSVSVPACALSQVPLAKLGCSIARSRGRHLGGWRRLMAMGTAVCLGALLGSERAVSSRTAF